MKKILSIVLVIVLLFAIVPNGLINITASAYTSGIFTYTVSNGEATITDCSPYINGDVVIPEKIGEYTVTTIGQGAFYYCKKIESLTFPKSIKKIEKNTFDLCEMLTEVHITDLAAWCNITFADSDSNPLYFARDLYLDGVLVTDLVIPEGVTNINAYSFYKCKSIESVTIPNTVISIGDSAFSHDFNSTSSISRVNITDLAAWCNIDFANNSSNPVYFSKNLYIDGVLATDLVIPDSVVSISDYAFNNCKSIKSVIIPDSVKRIGFNAFGGCDNIDALTLPFVGESLEATRNTHFGYIFGMSEGYNNDILPTTLKNVIITNATAIAAKAFSGCVNITNISIPKTVASIGSDAFSGCTSLTNITIDAENKNFVSLDGVLFNKQKTELICYPYGKGKIETSYDIPYGVTSIAPYTFNYCTSLVKITIPDSVKTIGEYAFNNCTSLIDITIPNSVTSIGNRAFWCCFGLENIKLSTGLETIGEYAFAYCRNLSSITVTNNVTSIGESAFYDCKNLKNATLSNGMTTISTKLFSGCNSLESITIPNSVTSIRPYAFSSCTSLKSVIVPDSVTSIGRSAFAYCNKLESITLPFVGSSLDGTTDNHFGYIFGASSYSQNDTEVPASLKNVVITKAVNIAKNAFRYCNGIESVIIPKSVSEIGQNAFRGCRSLIDITVDIENESYTSFEGVLFDKLKTTLIHYPSGKQNSHIYYKIPEGVANIGDYAFYNCNNLNKIILPSTVKVISNEAFNMCTGITEVYYCGTPENWSAIEIGDYNSYLTDAKIYYHKSDEGEITDKASCANTGIKSYKCILCNEVIKTDIVPMISHNYNLGEITKKPTCNSKGIRTYTCKICGFTKTETIQKNPTVHTYKKVVTKATINKNGAIMDKCSVCGKVESRKVIKLVKSIKLSTTNYTYNGKTKKPSVTVKNSKGDKLKKDVDYTVTYPSGRKKVGSYKVKVKFKGNYSGTEYLTFKINPAKTNVNKLTAGKKSLKVSISKKSTQVTGFEIEYSTSKSFKSSKKKTTTKTSYTIKSLKAKKTYYVRVRSYKTVSGKKYYSSWSSYKSKKTK